MPSIRKLHLYGGWAAYLRGRRLALRLEFVGENGGYPCFPPLAQHEMLQDRVGACATNERSGGLALDARCQEEAIEAEEVALADCGLALVDDA